MSAVYPTWRCSNCETMNEQTTSSCIVCSEPRVRLSSAAEEPRPERVFDVAAFKRLFTEARARECERIGALIFSLFALHYLASTGHLAVWRNHVRDNILFSALGLITVSVISLGLAVIWRRYTLVRLYGPFVASLLLVVWLLL